MKFKFFSFFLALITLLTFNSFAWAQDGTGQPGGRQERGSGKRHSGGMHKGFLTQLNLTEAQQQQARAIFENQRTSTRALHDELRQIRSQPQGGQLSTEQQNRAQAIRTQFQSAKEKAHNDLLAILTPEQRTQFEQFRANKGQRGEGRGFGKRGGFGEGRRGGMGRGLKNLNLTEAQRQQARTIFENSAKNTQALREELQQLHSQRRQGGTLTTEQQNRAQELHTQLRAAMQKAHEQLQTILTPEQRQQMEQQRGRGDGRRMKQSNERTVY
jgi:Spy/CpxP family protein refolding chaperone